MIHEQLTFDDVEKGARLLPGTWTGGTAYIPQLGPTIYSADKTPMWPLES